MKFYCRKDRKRYKAPVMMDKQHCGMKHCSIPSLMFRLKERRQGITVEEKEEKLEAAITDMMKLFSQKKGFE